MKKLMYIELKTGYSDDGPAWIGYVKMSKSGKTLYWNDHAFKRYNCINGNYYDVETNEEYWISGVKKDGSDRLFDKGSKTMIDSKAVPEYLEYTGKNEIDLKSFEIVVIDDIFPVERINKLLNKI